ncbi:MAG: WD40 repeat domain-containing protein [Planctomycetota bacterium]
MTFLALAPLLAATLPASELSASHAPLVSITCAALLDEDTLLLGRTDGWIVPVDPKTGKDEDHVPFARHTSAIAGLAIDPAGELVAAASEGGVVALWPIQVEHESWARRAGLVGAYPGRFTSPTVEITPTPKPWHDAVELEWTHDGSHLVTWSYHQDHGASPTTVQVWTREGELVWTGPHARQVDVHPTELRLAAVVEDAVLLGWLGEGLQIIELEGAYDCVEFSPDGSTLAVGGSECRAWLLDAKMGAVKQSDTIDLQVVFGRYTQRLRWSPDGRRIAVVMAKVLHAGVLSASDLTVAWRSGLLGGRMWSVFDVTWTPLGSLVTGFQGTWIVDPATDRRTTLDGDQEWQDLVSVGDSEEFVLVAGGVARRFNAEGTEVRWKR